jgi:hypothetical protein
MPKTKGKLTSEEMDAMIRRVLEKAAGPLAPERILRALPKAFRPSKDELGRRLKGMITDGLLFRHPPVPKGRLPRFGLSAPNPADYLEPGLARLVAAIAKKGFAPEDVKAAIARTFAAAIASGALTSALSDEEAILAEMKRLDPQVAHGALVYIPHLRLGLADRFRDKLAFDRVVLAMAAQRHVQVQSHPVPSQLTGAEREAMVPNGVGGYYIAIGLRAE